MLHTRDPIPEKTHPGPAFWRGMLYAVVLTFSFGVVIWAILL